MNLRTESEKIIEEIENLDLVTIYKNEIKKFKFIKEINQYLTNNYKLNLRQI